MQIVILQLVKKRDLLGELENRNAHACGTIYSLGSEIMFRY